jgi:hypothetical protein
MQVQSRFLQVKQLIHWPDSTQSLQKVEGGRKPLALPLAGFGPPDRPQPPCGIISQIEALAKRPTARLFSGLRATRGG